MSQLLLDILNLVAANSSVGIMEGNPLTFVVEDRKDMGDRGRQDLKDLICRRILMERTIVLNERKKGGYFVEETFHQVWGQEAITMGIRKGPMCLHRQPEAATKEKGTQNGTGTGEKEEI